MMDALFNPLRRLAASAAVLALVAADPLTAFAQGVDASDEIEVEVDLYQIGASALDVTLLRPLGALSMVAGSVFFLASLPFVAPSQRIETTWDIFVYSAYDYTVIRPLGELY